MNNPAHSTLFLLRNSSGGETQNQDLHRISHPPVRLALDSCLNSTEVAETSLKAGNSLIARKAFGRAEEAFEQVQHYLIEVGEDWQPEANALVDELGLKLDKLWIRLKSTESRFKG